MPRQEIGFWMQALRIGVLICFNPLTEQNLVSRHNRISTNKSIEKYNVTSQFAETSRVPKLRDGTLQHGSAIEAIDKVCLAHRLWVEEEGAGIHATVRARRESRKSRIVSNDNIPPVDVANRATSHGSTGLLSSIG